MKLIDKFLKVELDLLDDINIKIEDREYTKDEINEFIQTLKEKKESIINNEINKEQNVKDLEIVNEYNKIIEKLEDISNIIFENTNIESSIEKEYIYVSVKYVDEGEFSKSYYYISDNPDIEIGDVVLVGRLNSNVNAIVKKVEKYNATNVPYPVEKTKYVIKILGKESDYYYDEDETEDRADTLTTMFLNVLVNKLSIKRLLKLMCVITENSKNSNQCLMTFKDVYKYDKKLFYVPRLNLFYYEYKDNKYRLAENNCYNEFLDGNVFDIMKNEAIEVPQIITYSIYNDKNYEKAINFCIENEIKIYDDTEPLNYIRAKSRLKNNKKLANLNGTTENSKYMPDEENEKFKFTSINEVLKYLEEYKEAKYVIPYPKYYVNNLSIDRLNGYIDYDYKIFKVLKFLKDKKYIDFELYKKTIEKYNNENIENLDIDKLNYEQLNDLVILIYMNEDICEGIVNKWANNKKLLKIVKRLVDIKSVI